MKTLNTCLNLAKIPIFGIIFLGLVTSSYSCNKEKKNPPHKDIFRCEIDGVPWEAECESNNIAWGCIAIDCQYYEDTGGFEIIASVKGDNPSGFHLFKSSASGGIIIGENELGSVTFGRNSFQYKVPICCPSVLSINTIDISNKIIKGYFDFILVAESINDTIFINNGYLNVKYRP